MSSTCSGAPNRTSRGGPAVPASCSVSISIPSISAARCSGTRSRHAAASPAWRGAYCPSGPPEPPVLANRTNRWRTHVKSALASTISRTHELGLAEALARGPERPLILGYHRVVDDFDGTARDEMPSMLTSTAMFERHLDLVGSRFRFTTLDEIGEHLADGRPFTERVAAVTFDDGYRDSYEQAFPILKRKGIPAAVFVVTDLVGRQRWQIHDQLFHLVTKAFAAWDDPRRELSALLRQLDLPAGHLLRSRAATSSPMMTVSALLPDLSMANI